MNDADKIASARALIDFADRMSDAALRVGLEGTAAWDQVAGAANIYHVQDTVAALADLADALAQENARLQGALHEAKAALIEVKREMWREAQPKWTMADFLNWAIVQQITSAIARARAALGDTP